jgi:AraC-like DNA-binding protein
VNGTTNGVEAHESYEILGGADCTIFAVSTPTESGQRSMKRAAELFAIDEWVSDCGLVEKTWRSHSEPEPAFMSIAVSRLQIVVTTQHDAAQLTARGPETRATVTPIPADAEFLGIVFRAGTFMPHRPLVGLVDRAVTLPGATPSSFWLDGSRWEIPTRENADVFVDGLVRKSLIVRDPLVAESFQADVDGSIRTLHRRVARATGLTRNTIWQIARADKAVEALGRGLSPQDAATLLGYSDQAHLTRSSGTQLRAWLRVTVRGYHYEGTGT